MAEKDLGRLRDAYAAAWETRQQTGDASPAVLVGHLSVPGLEVFSSPGPGQELMLSLWERGVHPEELERELRRALPGMAWTAVGSLARSAVEIARTFRGGEVWERVDRSWQDLPEGHRKLSDARKANDVVLRWLHEPVQKLALDLRVDEAASAALERCRQFPSANRSGWAEVYCWLLPDAASTVQVMVGKLRIGWATVSDAGWAALKSEQQRGIYADGSLFLDYSGDEMELVCFLPGER